MKKLSVLLALLALFFADAALAASAVVTSLTGSARSNPAPPRRAPCARATRWCRATRSPRARSALVLKFDDGQVAALTASSRMQITAYAYNPQSRTGNVLLSLVVGGMRAITGLIGHNQPGNVNFRAATATIGIRGSDGDIVTDGTTNVAITVREGEFTFTYEAARSPFRPDAGRSAPTARSPKAPHSRSSGACRRNSAAPSATSTISPTSSTTRALAYRGRARSCPATRNVTTPPATTSLPAAAVRGRDPTGGGPASNQ